MAFEDVANSTVRQAMDQGRQAAETASRAVEDDSGLSRVKISSDRLIRLHPPGMLGSSDRARRIASAPNPQSVR